MLKIAVSWHCGSGSDVSVIVSAFGLAWGWAAFWERPQLPLPGPWYSIPPSPSAAYCSSWGVFCLSRAVAEVRRERQPEFRSWLTRALAAGALFTAVQSYALWAISPTERGASEASRGVRPFIMVLCTLHALHFLIASWAVLRDGPGLGRQIRSRVPLGHFSLCRVSGTSWASVWWLCGGDFDCSVKRRRRNRKTSRAQNYADGFTPQYSVQIPKLIGYCCT